jgi:DNA-directed RNA polymerase subunit RPC12/RpoP
MKDDHFSECPYCRSNDLFTKPAYFEHAKKHGKVDIHCRKCGYIATGIIEPVAIKVDMIDNKPIRMR